MVFAIIYFSYGAFQNHSYGWGDMYVHHAWIYGLKEGQKQGEERVFEIYRLYRDKYTENQIAEQMKIDVDEVRHILEKFKE